MYVGESPDLNSQEQEVHLLALGYSSAHLSYSKEYIGES